MVFKDYLFNLQCIVNCDVRTKNDPLLIVVIRAPGMGTLKVSLAAECPTLDDHSVWNGHAEGAEAALQLFSEPKSTRAV